MRYRKNWEVGFVVEEFFEETMHNRGFSMILHSWMHFGLDNRALGL
jgi:hypothetical protein